MRFFIALLTTLLIALPVRAATLYENERFGYAIGVPDSFRGHGESDNGDGQRFFQEGRPSRLSVWGGFITGQPDFASLADWAMRQDAENGWAVTYQASTPSWASWSGVKGGRVLYQRMIGLCGVGAYAAFRMEYSQADRREIDPVIERLVGSLRGTQC